MASTLYLTKGVSDVSRDRKLRERNVRFGHSFHSWIHIQCSKQTHRNVIQAAETLSDEIRILDEYVQLIIALSPTARKQEETAPKIGYRCLSPLHMTVFVLMEPRTARRQRVLEWKMLLVSVKICVVQWRGEGDAERLREFYGRVGESYPRAPPPPWLSHAFFAFACGF